jgi:hypothetical protein
MNGQLAFGVALDPKQQCITEAVDEGTIYSFNQEHGVLLLAAEKKDIETLLADVTLPCDLLLQYGERTYQFSNVHTVTIYPGTSLLTLENCSIDKLCDQKSVADENAQWDVLRSFFKKDFK